MSAHDDATLAHLEQSLKASPLASTAGITESDAIGVVRALQSDPDGLIDMLRTLTTPDLFRLIGRLAQLTAFALEVAGYTPDELAEKIRAHKEDR